MIRTAFLVMFFMLITILPLCSTAQDNEDFPEFIHRNKLYKTGSSWITIGGGSGYFPLFKIQQKNFCVDVNGRWKKHYFTLGFHYDGNEFITVRSGQRYFEFHGGYGWRSENLNRNLYAYIGPGYAFGYVFNREIQLITADTTLISARYLSFNTPNIYGEIQYTQKIFYDIGIGLALYGSANKHYQTVGIRLFVYFSTAFIDDI